jgi:hypothetical protein
MLEFPILQWFSKPFSTHEIIYIINSLKTNHSHGYDGISTKLLKIGAIYIYIYIYICYPLTHICNKSISTGTFPERLKYSIIKPLYKETKPIPQIIDQFHY